MDNSNSTSRFTKILVASIVAAILCSSIGWFVLNQNPIGFAMIGFILGLRFGGLFLKEREEEPEPEPRLPRKHIKLPAALRDSYYSDAVMKRIMEVYHPGEVQEDEEESEYDEDGGERVDDESNEADDYEDNGDVEDESEEMILDEDQEESEETVATSFFDTDYGYASEEEPSLSPWEIITYPTQIPFTLAILWPVIFIGLGFLSGRLATIDNLLDIASFLLLPSFVLIGLSGVLVLKEKTVANIFGKVLKDSESFLDGAVKLAIGLGGFIYFLFIK